MCCVGVREHHRTQSERGTGEARGALSPASLAYASFDFFILILPLFEAKLRVHRRELSCSLLALFFSAQGSSLEIPTHMYTKRKVEGPYSVADFGVKRCPVRCAALLFEHLFHCKTRFAASLAGGRSALHSQ